jgi:4-hydroxy-4-methyl-2-oxoglutarate aldolase
VTAAPETGRQRELEQLETLSTTVVADAMNRLGVAEGIRPVWAGARAAGTARTVWVRSGDNLAVHAALDQAKAGEILVINGGGDTSRALMGELMARRGILRQLAGWVIDGAVRDRVELEQLRVPVFARGVSPAGPYKHGPGHLDVPVAIGGVVVSPGDLLRGDDDGVVVVPADRAAEVIARAMQLVAEEQAKRDSYR